ncbi:30S ribosomal protein S12 methylthiotransferase RimO [Indioceanicola profundi]|uniref:30S ribosomal protein S12 methylthiotransferase RimO n=1 Tax=Indioceanicola profundi TaxID=2220096 RepID=UPI000E6AA0F2|nr:30S ribosomal protein S12 methylthiotransferase RimO [Indioceanicola profundi]
MANQSPQVGFVSLGCSKALVDSERIITRLRAEGYGIAPTYQDADIVVVNTCGFLNSAKQHSLDTIGKAIAENGKVIVTGCLGVEPARIRETHPTVLAVTGPQQYDAVLKAVREAAPIAHSPFTSLLPPGGMKLTPRHYSYLKISEGCNNSCTFCIIPQIRGKLASRPVADVLREAEGLAKAGTKELLVVSQDTSAYGVDVRYAADQWRDKEYRTKLKDLCTGLAELGIWVRLHYVYPYPEVDDLIELMVDGKLLPYLDIPFQHASPNVLKAMKRPANQEKVLNRIKSWRQACPDIAIRSTFIVGFPTETDGDFEFMLQWLEEAEIDRVGCFRYEHVDGAKANDLGGFVPEEVKDLRFNRLMESQQAISARVLRRRIGRTTPIIIDEVDEEGAIGRTKWDAPEVDGITFLQGETGLKPGDIVQAKIEESDEYDFWASRVHA